jgi:hypothetical protein
MYFRYFGPMVFDELSTLFCEFFCDNTLSNQIHNSTKVLKKISGISCLHQKQQC